MSFNSIVHRKIPQILCLDIDFVTLSKRVNEDTTGYIPTYKEFDLENERTKSIPVRRGHSNEQSHR